jgi:hypothetical protein
MKNVELHESTELLESAELLINEISKSKLLKVKFYKMI